MADFVKLDDFKRVKLEKKFGRVYDYLKATGNDGHIYYVEDSVDDSGSWEVFRCLNHRGQLLRFGYGDGAEVYFLPVK